LRAPRGRFGERRTFGEWSMGFSATGNAQIMKGFTELEVGQQDLLSLVDQKRLKF
jgi:hypothetical protein